jgi:hypothetical protein
MCFLIVIIDVLVCKIKLVKSEFLGFWRMLLSGHFGCIQRNHLDIHARLDGFRKLEAQMLRQARVFQNVLALLRVPPSRAKMRLDSGIG